jgi:hypothetical protein
MPPRISYVTFNHFARNNVAFLCSQGRICTSVCEIPRKTNPFNSLAASLVVPHAKFSTAPANRINIDHSATRMPADQRAELRRKEQLDIDARALEKNFTRDWRVGDVYAPHDLGSAEARKFRRRRGPSRDAFDALAMNPLDCYKVSSVIDPFAHLLI